MGRLDLNYNPYSRFPGANTLNAVPQKTSSFDWGGALNGVFSGAGSYFGAQAQAQAAEQMAKMNLEQVRAQIAEQKREFDAQFGNQQALQAARQKAYNEVINRGKSQASSGESSFLSSVNQANAEQAQREADIKAGTAEQLQGAGQQINSQLAQQGIRGGQAAAYAGQQLGQIGVNAQGNVNQMKYQDSANRDALCRAYMGAKAGQGQAATLQSIAF